MLSLNRRNRGVTQTPFLIVAIVVAIIAILIAYFMNNTKTAALQQMDNALRARDDAENKATERQGTINEIATILGYSGGEDVTGINLDAVRTDLRIVNENRIQPKIDGQDLTVALVIKNLAENVNGVRNTFADLRATRERLRQEIEQVRTQGQQELQAQRQATQAVRTEKSTLQQRFDKRVSDDEEMVNTLRAQLDSTRTQLEQAEGRYREMDGKYKGEIARYRTRITELTQVEERRTTALPDGQVIRGLERDFDPRGEGYAFIYIDIGRKHGVKDGTKFEVFALEKGGKRTAKGTIVVKKALDDLAECAILDQLDERNPIVRGDFIANPFFEKGSTQHFALVGTFDGQTTNHTREEWARIIKEHGHAYQTKILANTNFVITGSDPQDDTSQWAMKELFKVEHVTENEVLNWFDYGTYTPREGSLQRK